jgi:hypothetical protein
MYCKHCDKEVLSVENDGVLYCKECGMMLDSITVQQTRLQTDSEHHTKAIQDSDVFTSHKSSKINAFQRVLYTDDRYDFIPDKTKDYILHLYKVASRNNNIFTHYDEIIIYYLYYLAQFEEDIRTEPVQLTRQQIFDKYRFHEQFPRLYIPPRFNKNGKYDNCSDHERIKWNNRIISRKIKRLYQVYQENGFTFNKLSIVPSRELVNKPDDLDPITLKRISNHTSESTSKQVDISDYEEY